MYLFIARKTNKQTNTHKKQKSELKNDMFAQNHKKCYTIAYLHRLDLEFRGQKYPYNNIMDTFGFQFQNSAKAYNGPWFAFPFMYN